jgi:hypothetical protein
MKIFKSALACAVLMSGTSAFANPPSWSISESSGAVSIMRPGITLAGVRGKALAAGDVIATGKTGRAVLVRGGEYLMVSANSRITIAQPKAGSMTQIVQSFGNAVFKINKKATPHFAVQTPYLAAVVKGTTFSVTVSESGASVQVTEGRVEVQTPDGGATHMVTPGEIGLVRAGMPGRLTIQGDTTVNIDSPNAPVVAPPVEMVVDTAAAAEPGKEDLVAVEEKSSNNVIAEAIGEGAVDLGKASGGMVFGDSTLVASVSPALIKEAPQPAVAEPPVVIQVEPTPQSLPPTPADSPPVEVVEPLPPALLPPVDVAEAPDQKPPVLIDSNPVDPTPPQPVVDLLPPPVVKPDVFVDHLPGKLDPLPDILVPADPPIDPGPQNNGNNGNGNGNGNNGNGNNGNSNGNNGNGNNGSGSGNGGPSVP